MQRSISAGTRAWPVAMTLAVMALAGCTSLALTAANVPAAFGDYQHDRNFAYGAEARQRLDVFRPDAVAPGPGRAVVVFFYGGGWTEGAKEQYRFVAAALTSRGYVVVLPDYRLYPEVRFPAFLEDAAKAVRWTREHARELGGDPNRIFLAGHSAGAHIAAMLTFDERWLQAVGGDKTWISGFIGLSGPYDFLPIIDPVVQQVFASLDDLRQSQPISFVDGGEPPALLIHGEADKRVSPTNSHHLAARILEHRGKVTELYIPGMSHGGTLASLSVYFRKREPVVDEIDTFLKQARSP